MDETTNYDVVNFTNIFDKEFVGMYSGKETKFAPHSVTQLPRFLANHYAEHLATKVLIEKGIEWGNDSLKRKDVIAEILAQMPKKTEAVVAEPAVKEEPEFADLEEESPDPEPGEGIGCPICAKVYKTEAAMKAHNTRSHKV